jgi:ornithine cyclodeaminase/alanine dehydrogenase-like protein (mu-crystallin family)
LLRRSLVCPDFPDQALAEGECQQLDESEIGPALADLVRNRDQYEKHQGRPTVFDSTGWALEDLVAAEILTSLGKEAGCGTTVDISCVSDDPKNPYGFVDRYLRKNERLASVRAR